MSDNEVEVGLINSPPPPCKPPTPPGSSVERERSGSKSGVQEAPVFDPAALKKKKVRKSVVFEAVANGNGVVGEFDGEDKATAERHSMSMSSPCPVLSSGLMASLDRHRAGVGLL